MDPEARKYAITAIVSIFDKACGNANSFENRDNARYLIDDAYNAWARKWQDADARAREGK